MFINNKTFFKSRLETDEAADILKDFQKAVLENDSMSTEKNLNLIKQNTKLRIKENYINPVINRLMPSQDEDITDERATIFYQGIRCGNMHQGQTTESTALVLDVSGSQEYRIEFLRQFQRC